MHFFYFAGVDIAQPASIGVVKKINGQMVALKKLNCKIDFCFIKGNDFVIQNDRGVEEIFIKRNDSGIINLLKRKDPLIAISRHIGSNCYDVVYIRHLVFNLNFLFFLKRIRKFVPQVFLEVPTYPYTFEMLSKLPGKKAGEQVRLFKRVAIDWMVRSLIRYFVDRFVLTIPKTSLWGVPVVSIDNAVSIESVRLRNQPDNGNRIIIAAATNIDIWQGLDRVVRGLYDYTQRRKHIGDDLVVKIAGEGADREHLTRLVKEMHLENNFVFCGPLKHEALDDLYDQADIAIGSLGRHRQKTNTVSTLKVKEYCAKGIPFIYSNDEPTLTGRENFALKFSADESPIDFDRVIGFVRRIRGTPEIRLEMRRFAEKNYDWSKQMGIIHNQVLLSKKMRHRENEKPFLKERAIR